MAKEIDHQVQEVQRAPYRINPRRNTLKYVIIKLIKIKHIETNNSIAEIKNTLEGINSRISEAE